MGGVREGKWKELRVISDLLKSGLDVYPAAVDDQGIDCVIRTENGGRVTYYDVQIKGYRGYNRVIGVSRRTVEQQTGAYLLVLAFFHPHPKRDEVFFLTRRQVLDLKDRDFGPGGDGKWGDLLFNKQDRESFARQMIEHLPDSLVMEAPERGEVI
jgi:hypothetical protein